ncbi:hypothetical protein PM082_018776 [Marasmius tenuissimus]|nr:hypothetical protein PM082_018776 [Marasmius tenuissimus]
MRRKRLYSDTLSIPFLAAANPHTFESRPDCDDTVYSQRPPSAGYSSRDSLGANVEADANGPSYSTGGR